MTMMLIGGGGGGGGGGGDNNVQSVWEREIFGDLKYRYSLFCSIPSPSYQPTPSPMHAIDTVPIS